MNTIFHTPAISAYKEHTILSRSAHLPEYKVVGVRSSKTGFKTPTQTIRVCEACRRESDLVSGVAAFPPAVWLLIGELNEGSFSVGKINGVPEKATIGLCRDHFKAWKSGDKAALSIVDPSGFRASLLGTE